MTDNEGGGMTHGIWHADGNAGEPIAVDMRTIPNERVERCRDLAELVGVEPIPEGEVAPVAFVMSNGDQFDIAEILIAYAEKVLAHA